MKTIERSIPGAGYIETIREILAEMNRAHDGPGESRDKAQERALEMALEICTRNTEWHAPGASLEITKDNEFMILLGTGGPACRIVGELDEHGSPEKALLEWQDWGTPWTEHPESREWSAELTEFAGLFYWGE